MTTQNNAFSRRGWFIFSTMTALACFGFAWLITPAQWADWVQHPALSPTPETTHAGGQLLRLMLIVCGIFVLVIPTLLRINSTSTSHSTLPLPPILSSTLWTLATLVVLGLLVRLPRLGESLWYDEIAAWRESGQYSPAVIIGNLYDPSNHILHTLLTHWSVEWLGDSGLRLPALIFSLLGIPATFALARRVASNRCALLAAGLMAVMPIAVLEGVEARGYSMMIFFAALISWLWLKGRDEGRAWVWVMYAGACALGTWSHLMTVCVPLGHGLWLLGAMIHSRLVREHLQAGTALILAAVFTLTLYAPVLPDLMSQQSAFGWLGSEQPGVFGIEGGHLLLSFGGVWSWWAMPGIMLAFFGAWKIGREPRQGQALGLAFLGLPVLVLVVLVGKSWFYARFGLFLLPGIALILARGGETLWEVRKTLGLTVAIIILAAWTGDLVLRPPKQPLREAVNFVADYREDSDDRPVMVIGLVHGVMDAYGESFPRVGGSTLVDDLRDDLKKHDPEWVIMLYPRKISWEIQALLDDRGFGVARSFPGWADWGHGEVRIFRRREK